MSSHNSIIHGDTLNKAFRDENLISADLPELKRYLLACTEIREVDVLNPRVLEGIPKRKEFIRELISIKIEETKAIHATRSIIIAIIFSSLAFGISLTQFIYSATKVESASQSTAPGISTP
jgi:hypothetical protein